MKNIIAVFMILLTFYCLELFSQTPSSSSKKNGTMKVRKKQERDTMREEKAINVLQKLKF